MRGPLGKLYDFLLERVDVETFLSEHLGQPFEFGGLESKNAWCVFHSEANAPSLAITREGKFYCHNGACGASGANVIQFVERLKKYSLRQALDYLYSRYIRPIISPNVAEQYHSNLAATPFMLQWLKTNRGIDKNTVDAFQLGFDNRRITIPIWSEFEQLVNIRRYDYTRTHPVKMLPYAGGYGEKALFPFAQVFNQDVVLCEGEWDALLLIQNGFNAITQTAGVGGWNDGWDELFKGRRVWIVFDVNDDLDVGQKCARKRAQALSFWADAVHIIKLPLAKKGGDVTDYLHHGGHTSADFAALMEGAELIAKAPSKVKKKVKLDGSPIFELPLDEASKSQYYQQQIATKAVVIGKEMSPYIVPRRVAVQCPTAVCQSCPFGGRGCDAFDLLEDPSHALLLSDNSKKTQQEAVRGILGVPDACQAQIEEIEHCNLEGTQIVPETTYELASSTYVIRSSLYLGHGLKCNQAYRFEGVTATDRKQKAVHVMTKSEASQTAVESFQLTDEVKAQLQVFRSEKPQEKLDEIYKHLAINATRILQRPDLHMAIDLVFHSPMAFRLNNERVAKGWLEALILGDTRTGKGYVAEGLVRYYQLGGVTSCENASFAGLVGGVQQLDGKWFVTWGKIPLYDGRLLILDECSALQVEDIQRMSRVRSEGKAEVTKIHTEETWARTRLVWLANPRNGDQMAAHNTGIEAVRELIGRNEDIARFDYAMTVASNEVPSKIINARHVTRVVSPYTSEACRNLVLWTWSRKEEQIEFSNECVESVLAAAKSLGERYSSAIPLVQTENIRIKVARVAAAIAARTFSTDSSGERLLILPTHVTTAVDFLNHCYTKPSMGYSTFSNSALDRDQIKSTKTLDDRIDGLADRAMDFVEGCLELNALTPNDIADYTGQTREFASELVSTLVRERALRKNGPVYVKRAAFITYLRDKRELYKINGTPKKKVF